MVMAKDYYEILGLNRSADKEAIKRSYRRLARKFHPDVNKHHNAQKQFSAIQQAYGVLSDPKKRQLYDHYGHAGVDPRAAGGARGDPFSGFSRSAGNVGTGGPFSTRIDETGDLTDIFNQAFRNFTTASPGHRKGATAGTRSRSRRRGEDLHHDIEVPFDLAARGGKISLALAGSDGTQTIELKIPMGTCDQARLRIRSKGHPSVSGGPRGDLIITVHVEPHPFLRQDGLNLYVDLPISITEAIFGTTVEVPTLDGMATLKIPPGTSGGRKLRLSKAGIENARGKKGDIYIVINVDVPKNLNKADRQSLRQLGARLPDPRRNVPWR